MGSDFGLIVMDLFMVDGNRVRWTIGQKNASPTQYIDKYVGSG